MHTLETWLLNYAVNALWQVPIVFAAAWLAARASRRAGPAFQHVLWTSALVLEVFLPACSVRPDQAFLSLLHWLASFRQSSVVEDPHVIITMGPVQAASEGFHIPPALLAAVALLYLIALAYFVMRLSIGLYRTASLRRRSQPLALTGYAGQSYHRFARLFGVQDAIVAASAEIGSPITLGVRRPVLLLPSELDTNLLGEDLDAALAHEFAHMRRRDFAKNLAYEVLSLPIAFNPLLWLTRYRMAESRELVCDAMAADAVAGRQRYARSLLRLATKFSERPRHPTTPHAIGIFDANPFKNFERRIMSLTNKPTELRGAARLATAALSLALIAGACTSALAFRMQVAAPQTQTTAPAATITVDPKPVPHITPDTPAEQTTTPKAITLTIPRAGEAPRSYNLEVAATPGDPNGLPPGDYMLKVLPPPTTDPSQTQQPKLVRLSVGVIAGQRLTFTEPVYPEVAKKAKLNGTVILDAVIGKDGTMKSLHVASSTNPMFNNSAMEAVQHWTYKPYLLNGEPTEVETTITVNYALDPAPAPEPEPSPTPNPSASNSQSPAMPNQTMHIGGNVKAPIVISQVSPEFSQQAKDAKFSGDVMVYLWVDKTGHPSHVRVVKGVGMGLDEKAVDAVRQYRFKPATQDGKPVTADLYIDVNFQML